jgi:hypothetical protein
MKFLVISIKGDEALGYTHNLTLQLKNSNQVGNYKLEGISEKWQRFVIPLKRFDGITDWYYMKELVIVFDEKATRHTGTIYIDDISFTDSPFPRSTVAQYAKPTKKEPGILIDGDNAEWHGPKIQLSAAEDLTSGSIKDPKAAFARCTFQWDEDYLYLFANVNDRELVCTKSGSDIGFDDCLELFISSGGTTDARKEEEFLHLGFSPVGPEVWEWKSNTEPDDAAVRVAAKTGTCQGLKGYQIEAAISWQYLGIQPVEGTKISLSPAVHDFDLQNDSNGKYTWFYMHEGDKVQLGELILKK